MKEMTIDSTKLRELIIQEINLISDDELSGFYQFVHYFRLGSQVASNGTMVSSNGYHPELLNSTGDSKMSEYGFGSTNESERRAESDKASFSPLDESSDISDLEEALIAQGWAGHGIFKDDPEALKLFDEIEEERNRHWVGGE